jgi:hypothetical protein
MTIDEALGNFGATRQFEAFVNRKSQIQNRNLEEGVGNAPTSANADPVFETGAASLYLPAFQNWRFRQDSHLHPQI